MGVNDYNISHGPESVNGTGFHQAQAGAGRHRRPRSSMSAQPIERVQSPLSTSDVDSFISAYEMAERAEAMRRARRGRAIVGGVVSVALVRHWQRGRRA
jgi:hypothetical protein